MLNIGKEPDVTALQVIDYADPQVAHDMASGKMNTQEAKVLENIASAIRRGHPQWRGGPMRPDRICLVGSGPSLKETEGELRQAIWDGATLVTMNGGYHWCIERGLKPQTQIVMDARPTNARFLHPAVPKCNYVLASQCDPATWDAVDGRDHVWIFHAVVKQEGATSNLLDEFYQGQWIGVAGGTTVATRAISLLRTAGYLRFDLFGIDCCWLSRWQLERDGKSMRHGTDGHVLEYASRQEAQDMADYAANDYADHGWVPKEVGIHHVVPQPENDKDKFTLIHAGVRDKPETMRTFRVAYWQLKQCEDLLTMMKVNGQFFTLVPHGDGMFSHLLQALGTDDLDSLTLEKE